MCHFCDKSCVILMPQKEKPSQYKSLAGVGTENRFECTGLKVPKTKETADQEVAAWSAELFRVLPIMEILRETVEF